MKLNDSKTYFCIMGSTSNQLQNLANCTIKTGDKNISASAFACNIGVIFDRMIYMKEQLLTIYRSCYCHIRNIGHARRSLTKDATISLVHDFIASKVDHVNGSLYGIHKH